MSESDTATAADAVPEEEDSGIRWKMAITALVFGLLIGGVAAWATSNLGIALYAFLIVWVGSAYWLYQKPIPSAAIGSGLYATAMLLVITPVLFYIPGIMNSGEGAEGAGTFIGSILGLVIWGIAFFFIALVLFILGYFVNKRAKKKLDVA